MYSNVLVPVSSEEDRNSQAAFKVARLLAGDSGTITALHVIEVVPSFAEAYVPVDVTQKAEESAKAQFEASVPADIVKRVVLRGSPGPTILEHAEEIGADCIVVASHRPGLSDYFLGSTAARVVRHAQCAVHVIR